MNVKYNSLEKCKNHARQLRGVCQFVQKGNDFFIRNGADIKPTVDGEVALYQGIIYEDEARQK